MLDTLAESTQEDALAQGALATAAINAHESDAVDVEALTEEQDAKREEQRRRPPTAARQLGSRRLGNGHDQEENEPSRPGFEASAPGVKGGG